MAVTVVTQVKDSGDIKSKVVFEEATYFGVENGHLNVQDSRFSYAQFTPGSWVFAFKDESAAITPAPPRSQGRAIIA